MSAHCIQHVIDECDKRRQNFEGVGLSDVQVSLIEYAYWAGRDSVQSNSNTEGSLVSSTLDNKTTSLASLADDGQVTSTSSEDNLGCAGLVLILILSAVGFLGNMIYG